mmetsp:Transcript_8596/g.13643  ORF Transcript_8596/g.13643 Transcript_8596/m.13643 type:complete len:218 (-) Transcript_8596:71-724(-)
MQNFTNNVKQYNIDRNILSHMCIYLTHASTKESGGICHRAQGTGWFWLFTFFRFYLVLGHRSRIMLFHRLFVISWFILSRSWLFLFFWCLLLAFFFRWFVFSFIILLLHRSGVLSVLLRLWFHRLRCRVRLLSDRSRLVMFLFDGRGFFNGLLLDFHGLLFNFLAGDRSLLFLLHTEFSKESSSLYDFGFDFSLFSVGGGLLAAVQKLHVDCCNWCC